MEDEENRIADLEYASFATGTPDMFSDEMRGFWYAQEGKEMKRIRCWLRGLWSTYIKGRRWHGHCWDITTGRCVDCGKKQKQKQK